MYNNYQEEIEDECFSNPWSFESLEIELSKVGACFYVAEEDEAMGYIGFNMVLDSGHSSFNTKSFPAFFSNFSPTVIAEPSAYVKVYLSSLHNLVASS